MKGKLVLLLFVLPLAVQQTVLAQADWVLVSSIVAGGGGETDTIGQWDADPMISGTASLSGGFWNAEELPWLHIQRTGSAVLVSWPASFVGFQLEQSSSVSVGAAWGSVSQPVNVANGENQITMSIGPSTRFFRLRKP